MPAHTHMLIHISRIWDVQEEHKCIHVLPHTVPVYCAEYLPTHVIGGNDEQAKVVAIMTGARDGVLRLWKVYEGVNEAEVW